MTDPLSRIEPCPAHPLAVETSRRALFRAGSAILGALIALVLLVPGAAYVLSPLLSRKKGAGGAQGEGSSDQYQTLHVTFNDLPEGVPKEFPIIIKRQDAWVTYPPEPVGTVWLVRQKPGSKPPLLAFTSECPHLGCAITLAADGNGLFCPCHTSAFSLAGDRLNNVPPRGMDPLEVRLPNGPNGPVQVKFQRFRTMSEERIPLA